jgi:YHS domain-containing protein
MNLRLVVTPRTESEVLAGYSCSCGCTPQVTYARGGPEATDACCCGNQFVVGPRATTRVASGPADRIETQIFAAPWGEELQAAWALVADGGHAHDHDLTHHHRAGPWADLSAAALDPVCGMTVDTAGAQSKGLHSRYRDADYYFCGKGCKLEFDEDQERHLDPSHVPSM